MCDPFILGHPDSSLSHEQIKMRDSLAHGQHAVEQIEFVERPGYAASTGARVTSKPVPAPANTHAQSPSRPTALCCVDSSTRSRRSLNTAPCAGGTSCAGRVAHAGQRTQEMGEDQPDLRRFDTS